MSPRCRPAARTALVRLLGLPACVGLVTAASATAPPPSRAESPPGEAPAFFDDFAQPDAAALRASGWVLRDAPGHPGVPGARWSPQAIGTAASEQAGDGRVLRLSAHTDGRPGGTVQAQLCSPRRFLHGTHAARLRLADTPAQGPGGDPVVQTFYAVAPLRHDFDPDFSELDWEYLPQGGWGSPLPRLYAINWQTVRLDPWQAHNQARELPGRHGGWHQLTMQVDATTGRTHWFLDDTPVAHHGGRAQPVQPMSLNFSVWFSPDGLQPAGDLRRWVLEVDWVASVAGPVISPAQLRERVAQWRGQGVARLDQVSAAQPELGSPCDL
jgi:hypothetical protein